MGLTPYQIFINCRKQRIVIRGGVKNLENVLEYRNTGHYRYSQQWYARKYLYKFLRRIGRLKTRLKIINEEDFNTCMPIKYITDIYYFEISDGDYVYAFDIRSLGDCKIRPMINPYTQIPLSQENLDRYQKKQRWLKKYGYMTTFNRENIDIPIKQLTTDVFINVSQYQYVDSIWFEQLNMDQLKQLYTELNDIWQYRLNINAERRREIIHPDGVFCHNILQVSNYTTHMEDKLRRELLHSINRIVSCGLTENDRIAGALYFMLGLVLVSEAAALFHPELYNSSYYERETPSIPIDSVINFADISSLVFADD